MVIHNASIMNAIGCCGLQLYHFGETVSIPFWTDSWKPDSFADKIESNLRCGLHTLCLLGESSRSVVLVFSPGVSTQQPFKGHYLFEVGMGGVKKALMWSQTPPKPCHPAMPYMYLFTRGLLTFYVLNYA